MLPAVDKTSTPTNNSPADEKPWETIEAEVLDALLAARLAPSDVATRLATRASQYKGKTYQPPDNARPRQTKEGATAVKDAIQWLQKCEAACPLAEAGLGLKFAAEDHAVDVGGAGVASHRGGDDSSSLAPLLQPGDVLLFDYRCLHRGLANQGDVRREVAYAVYARQGVRDVQNFPSATTLEFD